MITKEILQQFCMKLDSHLSIKTPFTRDGKTYATDGRIMVWCDALPDCEGHEKAPKNVVAVTDGFAPDAAFIPCPQVEEKDCTECDGCGIVECEYGHEHDCPDCGATGLTYPPITIGARKLAGKYIALIATLPNAVVSESGEMHTPLSFKCDGALGLLMPIRQE